LRRVDDPGALPSARFQFSILNLLLVTSVVALIVGLMRAGTRDEPSDGYVSVAALLVLVGFAVNLIVAPWAALAPGPARWRVALAALVAVTLAMAMSFTALYRLQDADLHVLLFATQTLALAIPPMIVVASLLVARGSRYRLLPKSTVARLDAERPIA
jgi:hypothetical protein